MLIAECALTLFLLKLFVNWMYESCEIKKFWQVTFVKSVEQLVILGVMLAFCVVLNKTEAFQKLNGFCFPDVDAAEWDLEKNSPKDMRNVRREFNITVLMV
jgi:isochorismate hydrolase